MITLNSKQNELINCICNKKYILVKAPAGTGKTFCSIQCAKQYINTFSIDGGRKILILTFSRNARAQLIKELKNEPEISNNIEINNYHSFMKKYIDSYRNLLGIKKELCIINEDELISNLDLKGYSKSDIEQVPSIIQDFAYINNLTKVNLECDYSDLQKADSLIKLIDEYTKETGNICFSEFGYYFDKLLSKSSKLIYVISSLYPLIILDEYQDTDYYQETFLRKILKNSNAIFFADDLQMIYSFRGADKERLNQLYDTYNNIHTIEFDEIFRYSNKPDIIDLLYKIRNGIDYNYDNITNGKLIDLKVKISPKWRFAKKSKNAQYKILYNTLTFYIYKTVCKLLKEGKSIAFLCKEKKEVKTLMECFISLNFHPRSYSDSEHLIKVSRLLKNIIFKHAINENINDYIALSVLCTNREILDSRNIDLLKTCDISRIRTGILAEFKKVFNINKLNYTNNDKLLFIYELIKILEKYKYDINYSTLNFVKRCLSLDNIDSQKIDNLLISKQYINSYSDIKSGLYIMTMHQSKGKEFDNVFVIDIDNISKDKNLTYVTHSRMKCSLYPVKLNYSGLDFINKTK